jgi:hypothetical protein
MTDDPARLRRLALLGFVAHYPGVRVIGGRRLRPEWARRNLALLGATLVAMGAAGMVGARSGHAVTGVVATWAIGHFAWSGWLAWGIATGRALEPAPAGG